MQTALQHPASLQVCKQSITGRENPSVWKQLRCIKGTCGRDGTRSNPELITSRLYHRWKGVERSKKRKINNFKPGTKDSRRGGDQEDGGEYGNLSCTCCVLANRPPFKWIENWLLSMYIDAELCICVHILIPHTNNTPPTVFHDENISMTDALQRPGSHHQLWELPSKAGNINHLCSNRQHFEWLNCGCWVTANSLSTKGKKVSAVRCEK